MRNQLCSTHQTFIQNPLTDPRYTQWQLCIKQEDQALLSTTAIHLRTLGLHPHWDGYRYLLTGIPIYAKTPGMRLHKELYCDIAELCHIANTQCIEHSIRRAIKHAWQKRDLAIWAHYFPLNGNGNIDCPSNKLFIATLAEML